MGSGPPLALLGGLTPENGLPVGLARWLEVQTMTPFATTSRSTGWRAAVVWRRGRPWRTWLPRSPMHWRHNSTQPVDVLGISTGGSIAQQLAADHPRGVRRLALVSAACRLENSGRTISARDGRARASTGPVAKCSPGSPATSFRRGEVGPRPERRWHGWAHCCIRTPATSGIWRSRWTAEDAFDLRSWRRSRRRR